MQKYFRLASLRVVSCTLSVMTAIGIFGAIAINAQEATQPKRTLDFEGNSVFSRQELLEVANKCLDGLAKSGDEDAASDYCFYKVREHMFAKGYLQAQLGKPREQHTETGVKTVISVKEGALYRLGEIEIDGSRLFTPTQIREMINLKTGDVANGESLSVALYERVKRLYGNFGYITYTAEVTPKFHLEDGAPEGVVDFDVTIDEGHLFTVRTIKFEGNGSTPADALQRDLLLRRGDVFNVELLDESLTRINRTGLFAPINGDRDVDYYSGHGSSEVDLTIHLKKREATLTSLARP